MIALDTGVNDGSAMRARLEKSFDHWIDISKHVGRRTRPAPSAPQEIDILVNLNGYFGETRMGVFARRPAPIQVNYLGFPATLGAPYMDYIIADKIVIPESEQAFYDEKVVYLPGCYQANDDQGRAMAPHAQPRRGRTAGQGLCLLQFQQRLQADAGDFRLLDADSETGGRQRAVAAGKPRALCRKSAARRPKRAASPATG